MEKLILETFGYRVSTMPKIEVPVQISTDNIVLINPPQEIDSILTLLNATFIVGTEHLERDRDCLIETDKYYITLYESFFYMDRIALMIKK